MNDKEMIQQMAELMVIAFFNMNNTLHALTQSSCEEVKKEYEGEALSYLLNCKKVYDECSDEQKDANLLNCMGRLSVIFMAQRDIPGFHDILNSIKPKSPGSLNGDYMKEFFKINKQYFTEVEF